MLAATLSAQQPSNTIADLVQQADAAPDEAETLSLTRRALALSKQAVAREDRDAFLTLLSHLTRSLQIQAQDGRGQEAAALLHQTYALADAAGMLEQAAHYRRLAESAQLVDDLTTMDKAVRDGLGDQKIGLYEQTLLLMLGARVQTQLGRLDVAVSYLEFAIRGAHGLAKEKPQDAQTAQAYAAAVRNTVMTAADLYLMNGDYQNAQEILAGAPVGKEKFQLGNHLDDPGCQLYSLVAQMLGEHKTAKAAEAAEAAERELYGRCVEGMISARSMSVIAPKLVRKAIADGDLDRAVRRFRALTKAFERYPDGAHLRRRIASQEMELATRGALKTDAALRRRADEAFEHLLESWHKSPLLPDGVGLLHVDDRATLFANYIRFLAKTEPGPEGAEAALQQVLRAHAASRHLRETPSVDAIRNKLLTTDHGMLVLLPGRITSGMLIVDGQGVTAVDLPDAIRLRPAAERLIRRACQLVDAPTSNPARWQRSARTLCGLLLSDEVQARIAGWKRMSVCGAGMLHNAPFELLPIQVQGETRYLGEHLAIDYFANLTRAVETPARRKQPSVLLAASLQTRQDGARPVRMDREALRPSLARYRSQTELFDQDVGDAEILQHLPKVGVAHLIGHGAHNEGSRFQNGIRFSDAKGGSLWGDKIVKLDLSGLVVIVGSCQQGANPLRRGGEPMAASLAGALMQANARCVIVPLSNLTFGYHVEAMATVHEQLGRGASPASALYAARRALAKGDRDAAWVELMLMQLHGRGF